MKVYRLYTGGTDTYKGWNGTPTTPYNNHTIATIKDPNGAVSSKEITSIPSPFARIDLVKAAFAEVCQACNGKTGTALTKELDGQTIYHKMVSDALDVGEIFFNIDKLSTMVEVIAWNPQGMTRQTNNATLGERCYVNALNTYWKADGKTYNFDKVQNIYILNYKNGPKPLNIIGATSPATLFFSNANDLSYVKGIQFGQDKPFDNEYQPLYKRDTAYVEYLWWLKCSTTDFATLFPEVDKYIDYTYAAIADQSLKNDLLTIQQQSGNTPAGLVPISITSNGQNNNVEVLGNGLYQKEQKPTASSDFTIKSTRKPGCNHLVLPVVSGNKYQNWLYTTGVWGNKNAAPAFDSTPIAQRRLPFDNTQQPYLTISDFLEDNILVSPHKLNSNLFYDGGFQDNSLSYLLPLTPLFFEYFSADDLVTKKMLTMQKIAGGNVEVDLSIPTKKGSIQYSRLYTPADADKMNNEGHIINETELEDADISIMPAVETPANVTPYYTLAAIAPFGRKLSLTLYENGKAVNPNGAPQMRNNNYTDMYQTTVYTITQKFECVQVETASGKSMAIPTLPDKVGENSIAFAVDLGTSNTHIEYTINGNTRQCMPLEYSANDGVVGLMFLPRAQVIGGTTIETGLKEIRSILERDLIPESLETNGTYHFPTRTALSYSKGIQWGISTNPMELTNACLTLGKDLPLDYDNYATNIKWSNKVNAQSLMEYYIRNLMLIMRNKVLTLGGDLAKTSLTWFYPTSMTNRRINEFQTIWSQEFQNMFGSVNTPVKISESLAPVNFHTQNNATAKDMLTIDIGGGTTDMAFASKGNVVCVTSMRFAANALFEDSFSTVNGNNGIIDYFKPQYFELIDAMPELTELRPILSKFENSTTDLANVLFTVPEIPCVKGANNGKGVQGDRIDFIIKLRKDEHFKLEFVIFYAAILYHAGKIMQAKGLPLPRHIAFSGNGSNLLKVLATPDKDGKKMLADFSKVVLEEATGKKYEDGNKLELLGFGDGVQPKCVTCKGGLLPANNNTAPATVVLSSADDTLASGLTFKDIDDAYIGKVMEETYRFFETLRKVDKKYNFNENFGVSKESWDVLDDILSSKEDIKTFISNGLDARKGLDSDPINETFFFYPIASVLQQYSVNMYNL